MIDLSDVYTTIYLPGPQAGRLKMGDDARVVVDAGPGRDAIRLVAASISSRAFDLAERPKPDCQIDHGGNADILEKTRAYEFAKYL